MIMESRFHIIVIIKLLTLILFSFVLKVEVLEEKLHMLKKMYVLEINYFVYSQMQN